MASGGFKQMAASAGADLKENLAQKGQKSSFHGALMTSGSFKQMAAGSVDLKENVAQQQPADLEAELMVPSGLSLALQQ